MSPFDNGGDVLIDHVLVISLKVVAFQPHFPTTVLSILPFPHRQAYASALLCPSGLFLQPLFTRPSPPNLFSTSQNHSISSLVITEVVRSIPVHYATTSKRPFFFGVAGECHNSTISIMPCSIEGLIDSLVRDIACYGTKGKSQNGLRLHLLSLLFQVLQQPLHA